MATSLSVESGTKASEPIRVNDGVLRVGVIGYGYWGPNIVRNFHGQDKSRVVAVCDKSSKSLDRVRHAFPDVRTTNDCKELLTSPGSP
jgi:predicted dehydrogenase